MSGVEVSGNVHVRPDGYQSRVSDLLNRGAMDFLPITDATMERPDGTSTTTDCVIVRRTQIETVVCDEASAEPADDTPADGSAADDDPVPATPLVRAGW